MKIFLRPKDESILYLTLEALTQHPYLQFECHGFHLCLSIGGMSVQCTRSRHGWERGHLTVRGETTQVAALGRLRLAL